MSADVIDFAEHLQARRRGGWRAEAMQCECGKLWAATHPACDALECPACGRMVPTAPRERA